MILRFLFKLLNPYLDGRTRPKLKHGFWLRMRFKVYDVFMKLMKHYYHRYAFSDVVEVGQLKVTQEWRDFEFEQWMKQAGIETRQHFSTSSKMPKARKESYGYRPFYSFFHFRHQLTVSLGQESLTIDRTCDLSIVGSIDGLISLSNTSDIIPSSFFKAAWEMPEPEQRCRTDDINLRQESHSHNQKATGFDKKAKSHRQHEPFGKTKDQETPNKRRKVILNPGGKIEPPVEDKASKPVQPSNTTSTPTHKLRGAEVDESF